MRQAWWALGLSVSLAGCSSVTQERVQDYNEDGVYLFQRGDYAGARDSFQAALAVRPEDSGLLYNLGECYARLGDDARAEQFYAQCLQRAPDQNACRHALIVLLVREGRQPEARRLAEDWLARQPRSARPYAEDGWLWHQAGDLPRAQARLQQALDLDPHETLALTEMGRVYEDLHRPDRAVVLYERSLAQDPRQPDVTERVHFLLTKGAGRPQPD